MKFNSRQRNHNVDAGRIIDENSRKWIRKAIGVEKKKVEATRHSILSGPQGVGKTYGTIDECRQAGAKYIVISPGTSDVDLITRVACGVYSLAPGEELVVILDDADDIVFKDYATLNKWKIAMADVDYELDIIPSLNHPRSMNTIIQGLEKQVKANPRKQLPLDALKHFSTDDGLGITIPTDRVRFVILCNLNLEDSKSFSSNSKMYSAVKPVLDRIRYKRIDAPWESQWGWNAYVLSQTQPFEDYPLDDVQKVELMTWMYDHWHQLRSTSYRSTRRLVESMINEPDNYIDEWQNELKGH